MNTHQAFMLLLLTAGALFVPPLSERLKLFASPCEVIYGATIANLVPGANDPGNFVNSLSHFGFLLLLFLAGLEIDFQLIQKQGARWLSRAFCVALGIQLICITLGLLFHWQIVFIMMLGALSVSVLLVVMKEEGVTQSHFGQVILIIAAIGEFISILSITGYDLYTRYGVGLQLLEAVLKLLLLLAFGFASLRLSKALVLRFPKVFGRLLKQHDRAELGVRAALALMFCFAAIAVFLDVEDILAAFIAGTIFSFAFKDHHNLGNKLSAVGQGFFLPIFFISVGLGLQLSDLLHGISLYKLLGFLIVTLIVRIIALPLFRFLGLPWSETLPAALLLSSPLTIQVAIVQVGVDLGQIDSRTQGIALGAVIVGAVIFPLAARPFLPEHAKT